jgi:hypothetical protein
MLGTLSTRLGRIAKGWLILAFFVVEIVFIGKSEATEPANFTQTIRPKYNLPGRKPGRLSSGGYSKWQSRGQKRLRAYAGS